MFRDWAAERANFPHEAAEMALPHVVGNKVEAAYNSLVVRSFRHKVMSDRTEGVVRTRIAAGAPRSRPPRHHCSVFKAA
jgi:hypothetical protein